jgi:hypothetical protein
MCTFPLESAHFIFNECPIYTHEGASAKFLKRDFFGFFSFFVYDIQHCLICRPSDTTVSEDAGIDPPDSCDYGIGKSDAITTRLDLIHSRLDLIHTRLDLIHISAKFSLYLTRTDYSAWLRAILM